jgi:Uma2 family endonuclease
VAALRVERVADPIEPGVRPRRWTRDEYYRMAEAGIFGPEERLELVDGEVLVVSPQKEPHFVAIDASADALRVAFGAGHWVRTQGPLSLGQDSDPEPDVAVVVGTRHDYTDHPTTALLVIEVSLTTLAYDRETKASLYARAGILDYWILNLVERQIELNRDPGPLPDDRVGYRRRTVLKPGDAVRPLARPDAEIPVEALLPRAR